MHKRRVRASAPGKLILMGEHAVVYGYPALTTAVDLRLEVTLEQGNAPGVAVQLPQLEMASDLRRPGDLHEFAPRLFQRPLCSARLLQ